MPQAIGSKQALAAVLSAAACCACSGGDAHTATDGTVGSNGQPLPSGTVDCSSDPRLDDYVALDKRGELGALSFQLAEVTPAPPAKGSNTFRLQITDATGAPLEGELRVDPRMPDHGHGTSVKPRITSAGGGAYTVEQLFLFMPGVWRIQLEAYSGGTAPLDRTALFFCIQG